jgi:hypothetical protein
MRSAAILGLGVLALVGMGCVRYGPSTNPYQTKKEDSWEFGCPSSEKPEKGKAERRFHITKGSCVISATLATITSWSQDFQGHGIVHTPNTLEFYYFSLTKNGSLGVHSDKSNFDRESESESQKLTQAFFQPMFFYPKRGLWMMLADDGFLPFSAFYEEDPPYQRSKYEIFETKPLASTHSVLRVNTKETRLRPPPDPFIPYVQVSCGTQDRVSSGVVRRVSEEVRTDAQLGVLISPKIWEGWNTTTGLTLGTDPLAKDSYHGLTELSFLGISRVSDFAMNGAAGYSTDRGPTLRGDVYGKVAHVGFSGDADSHQGAFGFALWDAALFDSIPMMSTLSFDWTLTSFDREGWCARGYSWGNRLDLDARVCLIGPVWLGLQTQYQTHTYDLSGNQQGGLWTGALQLACRF